MEKQNKPPRPSVLNIFRNNLPNMNSSNSSLQQYTHAISLPQPRLQSSNNTPPLPIQGFPISQPQPRQQRESELQSQPGNHIPPSINGLQISQPPTLQLQMQPLASQMTIAMPIMNHQPPAFAPRILPTSFGRNQHLIIRPPVTLTTSVEGLTSQELTDSHQNLHWMNGTTIVNNNIDANINNSVISSIAYTPLLNPEAQVFAPTKKNDSMSVTAPEFIPRSMFLPGMSQESNTTQTVSSQQFGIPKTISRPGPKEVLIELTETKPRPTQLTIPDAAPSTFFKSPMKLVCAETQTVISGINWDANLCSKCKESMLIKNVPSKTSTLREAPVFLKMKEISMQHKLKYLAMKAAVIVRESTGISIKPQELKSKLISHLDNLCSYYGVESQTSTSWQHDIACTVAVSLLTDEPHLSSAQNNGKFLQQLKDEVESHMEIAQEILSQQEHEANNSKMAHFTQEDQLSDKSSGRSLSTHHKALSNNTETSNLAPQLVKEPSNFVSIPSKDKVISSQSDQTLIITSQDNDNAVLASDIEINSNNPNIRTADSSASTTVHSNQPIGLVSNLNYQMNCQSNAGVLNSNIQMGSVSNNSFVNSGLQTNPLLTLGTFNANNLMSTIPNDSALDASQLLNDISNSSPEMALLLKSQALKLNPLAVTNLSSPIQQTASEELLKLQLNYLEALNQFNTLNQQSMAVNVNSVSELDSDKFVSQISQSVADSKSNLHVPPELSPSLSVDDDISSALSSCGLDRERHLSSSTSNSDSDHKTVKRKQQHHGKDLTAAGGTKKVAPLDFRKPKTESNFEKQAAAYSSNLESKLNALFVSVSSQDINEVPFASQRMSLKPDKEGMIKSSELKPIRRLTPLQRKLLKKNDQESVGSLSVNDKLSQLKTSQPKTVELDEQLHSLSMSSGDMCAKQNEDSLKSSIWTMSGSRKSIHSSMTESGNASICSQFSKNSTKLLHNEMDSKVFNDSVVMSPKEDVPDLSYDDSVDITTLRRYISKELVIDIIPQKDVVNDQIHTWKHLQDELLPTTETYVDEKRNIDQVSCVQSPITFTQINEQSSNTQTRNKDQDSFYFQSDLKSEGNYYASMSSVTIPNTEFLEESEPLESVDTTPSIHVGEVIPSSTLSSVPDLHNDLVHEVDDAAEKPSSQFQSYSDIVKQKPIHKSSLVVLNSIKNGDKPYNSVDSSYPNVSSLNDSNPSHIVKNPMIISDLYELKKESEDDCMAPISSNAKASSCRRTWSSLFSPSDKNKHSSTDKEVDGQIDQSCKAIVDSHKAIDNHGNNNDDNREESDSSQQLFGKYGLDDFNTTPPSLKSNNAVEDGKGNGGDSKFGEEENMSNQRASAPVLESKWKVVTKKQKKTGENLDIDSLLKKFRTEDSYADLCKSVTEKYPGISKQTSQDVLETVFVETDGLAGMDEWEILDEVDVALSQMCPDKLT